MGFTRPRELVDVDRSASPTALGGSQFAWACVSTFVAGICLELISANTTKSSITFVASLVGLGCLSYALFQITRSANEIKRLVNHVWVLVAVGLVPTAALELWKILK